MDVAAPPPAASLPAPAAASAGGPAEPGVKRRLKVVDGADQGKTFFVPEAGSLTIGKSQKHAEIVLHDLYVARVHCELTIQGPRVVVTHLDGQNGTLVNNKAIAQPQELQIGDIVRVGNSHLRLELGAAGERVAEPEDEAEILPFASPEESEAVLEAVEIVEDAPPSPLDQVLKLENQLFGHYQIGQLLGRGKSGVVFHAQDVKNNNHVVALKVLAPHFPKSDAEMQGFVRALKVVAPLQHVHLVTLHTAGKTGPFCYIAREYVEGESVAELTEHLLKEGKLGWKRACRVAIHLAKALEFLHQRKAIHGNITPWNILIEDGTKMTKLADTMLDKALQIDWLQRTLVEKSLLRELSYRAPEQMDTHTAVDHRADLYALGTVLYAMMVGRPPYTGDSANAILTPMREGKLPKANKFPPETPPPFEAAVVKLLARRPEDRLQSAAKLLAVAEPLAATHEIKV
jgi:pSer/pThr/pTyr-binding forkhead associated (FHA) protein